MFEQAPKEPHGRGDVSVLLMQLHGPHQAVAHGAHPESPPESGQGEIRQETEQSGRL